MFSTKKCQPVLDGDVHHYLVATTISEAAYNAAMESLAREKSESKYVILALEAQLARKVEDRAVEYQNMSDRDVMMKFEELTGMK